MKLKIYYGKAEPIIATGVNQCRILGFAEKYPTWHAYPNDRPSMRAVEALERRGHLTVDRGLMMYKIRYP